jgi:hypothetical protein
VKKRVRNRREKQVTQLRREEFRCSAPTSENSPPLPDSGAFDAGLLSTAGVPVAENGGVYTLTDFPSMMQNFVCRGM